MLLDLRRYIETPEGTFGRLGDGDGQVCFTLEPNTGEGRLLAGEHVCRRSFYFHGGYPTWEIAVPGRSRILFHKGNIEEHTRGCVLVGMAHSMFGEPPKLGIAGSAEAFRRLMDHTAAVQEFRLRVTDPGWTV